MMNTTARIAACTLAGLCLAAAGCGEKTVSTPSGVKYADLVAGKGAEARAGDFIEAHYTGWLQADDSQFESSHDQDHQPIVFRLGLGQVIKGWDEGIVGMKPGGKRMLYIPAALAYGAQARGVLLPANSDLRFEIELLRIIDAFKAEDLREGDGATAKWNDTVEVRYSGALQDGSQKFDSDKDFDALPVVFQIGGPPPNPQSPPIPRGWEGGVVGMKEGGKRKLTIPAELGYGTQGNPPRIPPDANLVVDVELVKILTGIGAGSPP